MPAWLWSAWTWSRSACRFLCAIWRRLSSSAATSPSHCIRRASVSLLSVILDLQQARNLGEGNPEHGASDAGVLMLAGSAIGTVAGAESDLAKAEMIAELRPFRVGGFTVFFAWPLCPSLVNELPVMADYLSRVDGDISLSCVQVEVAKQSGGDMDREAAVDGFGGEDPAEIMRGESQRRPVDVGDACPHGQRVEQVADLAGRDDLQVVLGVALEQVR